MKYKILFISLTILSLEIIFITNCGIYYNVHGPQISFMEESYDFGNLAINSKAYHRFSFINTGNDTLKIFRINDT